MTLKIKSISYKCIRMAPDVPTSARKEYQTPQRFTGC